MNCELPLSFSIILLPNLDVFVVLTSKMISRPSGLMIECDDFNIIYDIICIDSDYESNSNKSIYMTIWIHKMPNMMSASIDLRPSIGSLRSNAYSIGI